jgi:putative SOS response-associated peptidase YedK
MCNLYSLNKKRDMVARHFRVTGNRATLFEPLDAIFPGHTAPVIRLADDGERELIPMSWGFVYPQSGKAPRRVTNVRDDKILESRFWRPSFEARRCLVPASSYCEPDANKPAGWHWFAVNGESQIEPSDRHLFAFPGIWQRWQGPIKKDGTPVDIETYSFMTTIPNRLTESINHERMPVLLSNENDFETWLKAPAAEAYKLARSYEPEGMRIVQSGSEKKDLMGAVLPDQKDQSAYDLFRE